MDNYQVVLEQERLLVFDHFNYEDAWNLGSMIVNRARKQELAISAEIWIGDYQVFRAALSGTSPYNAYWMQRKVNTVNMFHKSSLRLYYMNEAGEGGLPDAYLSQETYSFMGGAFPIVVKNVGFVGVACVSGLSQTMDHQVTVDGIAEFLGIENIPKVTEE